MFGATRAEPTSPGIGADAVPVPAEVTSIFGCGALTPDPPETPAFGMPAARPVSSGAGAGERDPLA